jgi:hypothetical protein
MREEKIAVHCKTREDWGNVQREMLRQGYCWGSRDKKVMYPSQELPYCIAVPKGDTGGMQKSPRAYWEEEGYKIIPASEYLVTEEFKVGDRVEIAGHSNIDTSGEYLGKTGTIRTVDKSDCEHPYQVSIDESVGIIWFSKVKVLTNQPKTTKKEESKRNEIIKDVFEEESSKVAQVINDEYGDEVSNTFGASPKLGAMFVEANKTEMIAYAKKVIADAKAAAEKAEKEAKK